MTLMRVRFQRMPALHSHRKPPTASRPRKISINCPVKDVSVHVEAGLAGDAGQAAVADEGCGVDERGVIAGQKQDRAGAFFRRADTAKRIGAVVGLCLFRG